MAACALLLDARRLERGPHRAVDVTQALRFVRRGFVLIPGRAVISKRGESVGAAEALPRLSDALWALLPATDRQDAGALAQRHSNADLQPLLEALA